jgi:hypothetical protein
MNIKRLRGPQFYKKKRMEKKQIQRDNVYAFSRTENRH